MISRLVISVLLTAFGLWFWVTVGRAETVCCKDLFTVGNKSYTEMGLLNEYAPDILHWVSDIEQEQFQDYIVSVGFDENRDGHRKSVQEWIGNDNWQNATHLRFNSFGERPQAVLNGGVVSVTMNQIYLVYYYFHPRDYASGTLDKTTHYLAKLFGQSVYHENDLEGGMFVLDRHDGKVIHAYALAHNDFDDRHLNGYGESPNKDDLIWIEAAGHGAHLLRRDSAHKVNENRKKFIRYVPEHRFEEQGKLSEYQGPEHNLSKKALSEAGWQGLPIAWPYRIEPLWDLFRAMYDNSDGQLLDGGTKLFAKRFEKHKIILSGFEKRTPARLDIYRALSGRHGGINKAHFPWGQGNDYYRLFDPVFMVLKREDMGQRHRKSHAPVSCQYLFNPYLQSLLDGRVVDWSETACPKFPKKYRKLNRRRLNKRCAEIKMRVPY